MRQKPRHLARLILAVAALPALALGLSCKGTNSTSVVETPPSLWQAYRPGEQASTLSVNQLKPELLSINQVKVGMTLAEVEKLLGQPNVAQAQNRNHYYFVDGKSQNYQTVIKYDQTDKVISVTGAALLHGPNLVLRHGDNPSKVTSTLGEADGFRRDPKAPPTVPDRFRFDNLDIWVDWRNGLVDYITVAEKSDIGH